MLRRSRYEKRTKQIFCTRSEKWSENRSSRFEPKILSTLNAKKTFSMFLPYHVETLQTTHFGSPAAPASAPPLSSASIAPIPPFWNLFCQAPSHLQLTNRRFKFGWEQDNRQQLQPKRKRCWNLQGKDLGTTNRIFRRILQSEILSHPTRKTHCRMNKISRKFPEFSRSVKKGLGGEGASQTRRK